MQFGMRKISDIDWFAYGPEAEKVYAWQKHTQLSKINEIVHQKEIQAQTYRCSALTKYFQLTQSNNFIMYRRSDSNQLTYWHKRNKYKLFNI